MNVQKMMQLDRWLGVPLCFAVTAVRALFPRRPPAGPVRSIGVSDARRSLMVAGI